MKIHLILPLPLPYIKGPQGRMGSLLVRLVMVMLSLLSIPSAINAQGLVFGEKTYNFNYGLFGYFTENFVIENTSDKYIITIQNGDASGKKRVKNGKVVLNDLVIPLIQQNDVIQQEVRLKSKNLINVRLVGGDAGAFITIGIASLTNVGGGTIGTTTITPNSTPVGVQLVVTVTSSITSPSVVPGSVSLERIDASGSLVASLGSLHDDGLNGDAVAGDKMFSILATILENTPGIVRLRVSAAFQGSLQRATSAPVTVNVTGSATGITISVPNNNAYLNTQLVTVRGTVGDPAATVIVNGVSAPVSGGAFVTTVPLNEGPNTLTAVANNANGTTSTASSLVTLDTTPPRVDIYSPANGSVTTDATVTVTGLINDIVVGTVNSQQATVTVNGVPAQVLNRTFTATNVPLTMGGNTIQARGVDRVGNNVTKTIMLTRQSTTQTTLRIYSGNGQSGPIQSLLPAPLVAQLLNAAGQPIPNTPVIFRVINQDGTLSLNGASGSGMSAIAINTDSQGLAPVRFFLSSRSGAGNNLVEASATGVVNTAVFSASATPAMAGLIIVDNGNNQSGVIGQALPLPLVAVVTDGGFNRLGGVPVIFTVKGGGGSFAGQPTFTTTSDGDGRVMATLTLGPNAGVSSNIVEASFTGNTGFPATFTASGMMPGPATATRISGVVLDNSNNPIPGVTMRLFQVNQGNNGNTPQQVATPVQTNAQGQFTMQPVPVGVFKLMADGGTAQRSGSWPNIEYDLITVAGQNNTVGSPIYLPEILSNNRLCVSPTTGGTLTIPQAPGFSLTVAPGSAIFPGGSRTGCISVTPVNMDKVPMVPGFGQQPRFVVTIQPVGTHFTTPAAITIPNVDGLAPRAVTEMYSFDHDLASFVSIGTGTVSEDGSVIQSDPGVGVLKAGWHCGGNPNQTGSAGKCKECEKCERNSCVPDKDFELKITQPSNVPSPFSFIAQRSFSNIATSDVIVAEASVTPSREITTLVWSVTATIGEIGNPNPSDQKGPTFSFVPRPPSHPAYNPVNGSRGRSTALSYTLTTKFCDKTDVKTITQDERDVIRQEYANHGIAIPQRESLNPVNATQNFTAAELNNTAYSVILGDPGPLAESVRSAYNDLLHDDIQVIPVGTSNLSSTTIIVTPGAQIDTIGKLLDTQPCNGAPTTGSCDDRVVDGNIVAGPNGIAETRAVNQATNNGLSISSGWRNPERNEAVRGALNSRHQFGNAIDLIVSTVPGKTSAQLYCILQTAAKSIVGTSNAFAENGASVRVCNSVDVDHVHVQQDP